MIFETLHDSSKRGELMLVDGGMCHWHLRRDGQLTIREIISTRRGAGSQMLARLRNIPGATSLFAKCPADLPANVWYQKRGFILESAETTKTGRLLKCWRLPLVRAYAPNAGRREIIYCADGNRRFAEIAIDAGLRYGARLPATCYYKPYFVDQDWKAPDRTAYMAALAEFKPWMATVLDWERAEQLPEVLDWAQEAAQHVECVVIIPKVRGGIWAVPRTIGGKPVRLGYSVPTAYGGTTVSTSEFRGWGVHLLGGDPGKQLELTLLLDVRSADTNYHLKNANEYAQCFVPSMCWPKLRDLGGYVGHDANYEAFRRSCHAILYQWRQLDAREHGAQMTLPFVEAAR